MLSGPLAQENSVDEAPPPPPSGMPSTAGGAPPPPPERPPPRTPPQEDYVAPEAHRIAQIESAVRAAVEASRVQPASQARPGVDCLLWLCVQAGRHREAVHVHVFDHRTGIEIDIGRAVEQVVSFEHVSLDGPTLAVAHQFLEGSRDQDEVEVRHSLEVLTARVAVCSVCGGSVAAYQFENSLQTFRNHTLPNYKWLIDKVVIQARRVGNGFHFAQIENQVRLCLL